MAFKITREVKVGVVFVIATAVLIWGILFLKGTEIFRHRHLFYAVYEKVDGLTESNPVSINGMNVGQVKQLFFSQKEPGKIVVQLYLTTDLPIPKNSTAKIFSSDLMGSKAVAIVLGNARVYLRDGDTLNAETEAGLGEEVNRQLLPLKHKAENLISSIDTIAGIVQQVLNKNTRDNLVLAIEHIKETLQNLAHTTYNLDTLIGSQRNRLAGIIINIESISTNLKQNNGKINNILDNLSAVSDSLARSNVPLTLNKVNKAVSDLDQVLQKINGGQGTLGMLVNDTSLYKEVTKAARDLNLLLEDIKANPKKYVKVSVF
ncbi:MAG TPA: MlaD family protein [Bacteroidales bacterium]|nr:MlaD family protein [Bacteroidales bacterium]